ncbi:hypothetical protein FKM82_020044 [Ascaphus truei]
MVYWDGLRGDIVHLTNSYREQEEKKVPSRYIMYNMFTVKQHFSLVKSAFGYNAEYFDILPWLFLLLAHSTEKSAGTVLLNRSPTIPSFMFTSFVLKTLSWRSNFNICICSLGPGD